MCLTENEAQRDSVVYSMRFCSELFISEPPLLILFLIILSIFCLFLVFCTLTKVIFVHLV